MRKMMNKKGFTLVELMIVVVILGILVAIAVPIYSAVTKNAKKKACAGNIRIMRSNLASYVMTGGEDGGMLGSAPSQDDLYDATKPFAKMFDNGKTPTCSNGATTDNEYTIEFDANDITKFTITCENSGCPNETASE